jgi:hypothetical protein
VNNWDKDIKANKEVFKILKNKRRRSNGFNKRWIFIIKSKSKDY